ncbi:hypothetical protein AVDCRST_MAG92-1177, partial [uncultured Coleofasciculus sp.]
YVIIVGLRQRKIFNSSGKRRLPNFFREIASLINSKKLLA